MWRWVTRTVVLGCVLALFAPALPAQTNGFVGIVELPTEGQEVTGMVIVRGFVLDAVDVVRIDLFVDDQFQHSANINIPRIDVIEIFPDSEGIQGRVPGFQTGFTAARFAIGPHTVHVEVVTSDGRTREVGRRTVVVNNQVNQSPFGSVDIPDSNGVHDASGSYPVLGWAADVDGIEQVDIVIDGLTYQQAVYGDGRPDVANSFPDLPAILHSGFIAHVDTTRIPEGVHQLHVRATDRRGMSRIIGRRTIQVFNTTNNLRPFGFLDEPLRDADLYGTCVLPPEGCAVSPCPPTPQVPERITTPILGWALDLGSREDTGRVAYVELLIDGARVLSSDDCAFNSRFGALVNCYGMPRFDVQRFYPTYPDVPRAGFMFALDVGRLITERGFSEGHHTLKLRVGDQENGFGEIPNTSGIPVFFRCANNNQDLPAFGFIDYPIKFDFIRGTVVFTGWALDQNFSGVQSVEIFVDGQFKGVAQYGLPRFDVQQVYPTINNSFFAGWRFTFDTTQLSDARHRLTVETVDGAGRRSIIGSVEFYVDNPD
jgi:N-acetylmuramoyl-L-alanine amidase